MIAFLNNLSIGEAFFAGISVGLATVMLFWVLSLCVRWMRMHWEARDE